MSTDTMRAAIMPAAGQVDDLIVADAPVPILRRNDVLVRIAAVSVNRSDVVNIQGAFPQTRFPQTPGRDFAGTIERGPQALCGMAVYGTGGDLGFTRQGTLAQYVALPRAAVAPVPEPLTLAEAAGVGVGFVTAWYGLVEIGRLRAGEVVVVTGANGAVGTAALQIARWRGTRAIAVVRRSDPSLMSQLLESGAEAVINLQDGDLSSQLLAATDNRGADLILDCVGSHVDATLYALARRGRQVALAARSDPNVKLNLRDFYHREARLLGIDTLKLSATACARLLMKMSPGFVNGSLRPPAISHTFPLSDVKEAFAVVWAGANRGKVVVAP